MKFKEVNLTLRKMSNGNILGHLRLTKKNNESVCIPVRHIRVKNIFQDQPNPNAEYPDIEYSLAAADAAQTLNSWMINDFRDGLDDKSKR